VLVVAPCAVSRVTYAAGTGVILGEIERLIEAADEQIVLQMYLFAANGQLELLLPRPAAPEHAELVARCLIEKRRRRPELPIAVILDSNTPSDPRHTRRGDTPLRAVLEQAGIDVLHANLFGNRFDARRRWLSARKNFHLAHGRCPPERWVRSQNRWQLSHNLEDHRKNLVIDRGRAGLVTSHNLIDTAADWYENAFLLEGDAARELWTIATTALGKALELPCGYDSARRGELEKLARTAPRAAGGSGEGFAHESDPDCRLLGAEAIRAELETLFARAAHGDTLYVASAYFSDGGLLELLARAAKRGAVVKILIDNIAGLPLPPHLRVPIKNLVNHEVTAVARRWCRDEPRFELRVHDSTAGPVMHLKSCALFGKHSLLVGGQANLTRNSFSGAWLETDVVTRAPAALAAFRAHFEALWSLPASTALGPLPPLERPLELLRSASLWTFARFGLRP
jgi:phosphatidylserine/phosphatidylglycerophosphate/cardiolipin synthase-like enzyme